MPSGDTSGLFDGIRMQQVITNLLTNAARYRARVTTVDLNGAGEEDYVAIAATDTWTAIPIQTQKTMFSAMVASKMSECSTQARPALLRAWSARLLAPKSSPNVKSIDAYVADPASRAGRRKPTSCPLCWRAPRLGVVPWSPISMLPRSRPRHIARRSVTLGVQGQNVCPHNAYTRVHQIPTALGNPA